MILTVLDLGKAVKAAVAKEGYLAWQYNTIGVSDGITQGNEGQSNTVLYGSSTDAHGFRDAILASVTRDHCR
jgi:dihydroxyacid dehydratase/phosphogluconate dehydratase